MVLYHTIYGVNSCRVVCVNVYYRLFLVLYLLNKKIETVGIKLKINHILINNDVNIALKFSVHPKADCKQLKHGNLTVKRFTKQISLFRIAYIGSIIIEFCNLF